MVTIHPSLTLVFDVDERLAGKQTKAEINRCYGHVGVPLVRTHAPAQPAAGETEAPFSNRARFIVSMGTKKYLHSADEGADELWDGIVEHWIGSMLFKVSNNMKAFNRRMRKIGLPELEFDRFDIELQGGEFTVGLAPSPEQIADRPIAAQVGLARTLLNDGTLAGAVRVDAPGAAAWEAQRAQAWDAWQAEQAASAQDDESGNAEAADVTEAAVPTGPMKHYVGPMPDFRTDPEAFAAWEQADREAKSYENTAVPITDSDELPPIGNPVEAAEAPRFDFAVDYSRWDVTFADGTVRPFDAAARAFCD